jgi:hypothetical protein
MANGVNAPVKRVQARVTHPALDPRATESDLDELRVRHDSMLPRCQIGDHLLT